MLISQYYLGRNKPFVRGVIPESYEGSGGAYTGEGLARETHSLLMDKTMLSDDFALSEAETQALPDAAKEKSFGRTQGQREIGFKTVDVFQWVSSWENQKETKSLTAKDIRL
jgi:hypothetical protein